jgi:hypothetical protein
MTIEQLSLFADNDAPSVPQVDTKDYCLVYLVTRHGGNKGNLFILHQEDAMKLCEDKCSKGRGRGGEWHFQWTSLSHFVDSNDRSAADRQYRDTHGNLTPFIFLADTGKQDKDLERLGIKKPSLKEICELLRTMGFCLQYGGGQ